MTDAPLARPYGRRSALLIIDVQNDFCPPSGSLAVTDGLATIPIINGLREKVGWDLIATSKDWHPKNHCSFFNTQLTAGRKDAKKFQTIMLDGMEQMMWPTHCVQDSFGSELHKDLVTSADDKVVLKGMDVDKECYSAFVDVKGGKTEMAKILKKANVTDVYVVGLAYDYCVGNTALDASREGFTTYVVEDATRGVAPETTTAMKLTLEKEGVRLISSEVILSQLADTGDRRQQAEQYMTKHRIPLIFQKLATSLVYQKPAAEDISTLLISELQKMQKQQVSQLSQLSLLEDDDLPTMFNMLDPTGKGELNGAQVAKALAGLGLKPPQSIEEHTFNVTQFTELIQSIS